jgi:hypothetical protein
MNRNKKFRAVYRDGSIQEIHAKTLEHALCLIANHDLVMGFEKLLPDGNPKPGGIYQTFSRN